MLRIRGGTKYNRLYSILMTKFKEARSREYCEDFNWLWTKARVTQREITGDPSATVRKHVITSFLMKYNIRMRARQRSKKTAKRILSPTKRNGMRPPGKKLVHTGRNDGYDDEWGRYKPRQRLNVDQCPLPFLVGTKRTYELIEKDINQHDHEVWISQPGSGLAKRQCTIQICLGPTGEQPRLGVIFRGTGKGVNNDKKAVHHPDIYVYYQENAWADTKMSVEWVQKTLSSSVKDDNRFVLFC